MSASDALRAFKAAVRPTVQTSTDTAILARPNLIDNLWFGIDGSVVASERAVYTKRPATRLCPRASRTTAYIFAPWFEG